MPLARNLLTVLGVMLMVTSPMWLLMAGNAADIEPFRFGITIIGALAMLMLVFGWKLHKSQRR